MPSGTLWACCNVGASAPEGYGGYYTFDEAQAYNPPSRDQINELVDNCTSVWTTQNGVNGRKFTGPNGGTIFLPAAGNRWYGEFNLAGSYGDYWSSTLNGSYPVSACSLDFFTGNVYWRSNGGRNGGLSVRPVR